MWSMFSRSFELLIINVGIRRLLSIALICFFHFFFIGVLSAQYRFDSWTTDNGLPQNGVRGITQTPDGYLWFTTFDGLVRFDGTKFTVFDKNNSPGILSNRYFLLRAEPDGTLYAGSEDSGLTVYQNGIFHTYTVSDGLPSNQILDLPVDKNGKFYLATSAGNCYFQDGKFTRVPESEIPNENRFYLSPSGNLWFYDKHGLRLITVDKRETSYPFKFNLYNERFTGLKLFEDSKGNLWFGDLSGVYSLNNGAMTKYTTADGVPPNVCLLPYTEEKDGSIWFASGAPWVAGVGLVRFKDGKFTTWGKSVGLSSNLIDEVFQDLEGTIWVASTDRGINRLQRQFVKSLSTNDGLVHHEVYPLLQTRNGDIYIGTIQGLSRYHDGKFDEVNIRNELGNHFSITALYEDETNKLWIGTAGGLYLLENQKIKRIDTLNNFTFWAIERDQSGNVWVGTNHGLLKFNHERKLISHFTTKDGLPGDDVKTVYQDKRGTIWIGTYGGVAALKSGDNLTSNPQQPKSEFISYTSEKGLASNRVRTIYEDTDGVLWIGTYDGGLSRLRDGKIVNCKIENGLYNNGVFKILEDDKQNFWISSNRGIFRVSKIELNAFADGRLTKVNSVSFGKQDGMLNTECNGGRSPSGIKTADGKFWFPTQEGVAILTPNEVPYNPLPPRVQIESVLVERQTTNFQNEITLRANEDNLEIRYTGISFIKPEQIKFRYRIEGLEENWIDVGTIREVYFPSLPAGDYTFQIIAANSDGVWNNQGTKLKIRVNAPFWQKTWFIVSCSLFAVAGVLLFFRLRVNELKRRQTAQLKFSRLLLESQEKERKRIASEMHDGIGQYLLAIKNWALFGLNSLSKENPAQQHLHEISETSSLALEEVREITHNLRPYQLERLGLSNTLEYTLKNIKNASTINFHTEIENIDGVLSDDSEIVFYRIVQECFNNVIKHSNAQNAWLSVIKKDNCLEFVCRDDGKGFDPGTARSSSKSGLGLSGLDERVRMLNGQYFIESEVGTGTTVFVKIQLNQ